MYFAAASHAMHHSEQVGWHVSGGWHFPWGWCIMWGMALSMGGGMSMGGGTFHGGLTLVLAWLMAGRGVASMGGGVKQRSRWAWMTVCSNTTSCLFQRQRSIPHFVRSDVLYVLLLGDVNEKVNQSGVRIAPSQGEWSLVCVLIYCPGGLGKKNNRKNVGFPVANEWLSCLSCLQLSTTKLVPLFPPPSSTPLWQCCTASNITAYFAVHTKCPCPLLKACVPIKHFHWKSTSCSQTVFPKVLSCPEQWYIHFLWQQLKSTLCFEIGKLHLESNSNDSSCFCWVINGCWALGITPCALNIPI